MEKKKYYVKPDVLTHQAIKFETMVSNNSNICIVDGKEILINPDNTWDYGP